ncbi:hypothetical protein CJ179_35165 [Rhodococcus sp. ACS1]|uniref:DUF427 domain-containing protein n=1 Tax=Rhodococcus sp. ACS1 TaxID=2028570 RepID=UPI000BB1314C|nr:DUF427 domain-containing protein [Rhodococcus sp. ACS1]PBC39295.1 hypothetical protein CJ179_35165 [Rhodococcus sp. ACS1]
MTDKPVLVPGLDHPITIAKARRRVVATVGGRTIADSAHALTLEEKDYPVVHYIPRADVNLSALEGTDHETYCPYEGVARRGVARYFSIGTDGIVLDNVVWTYADPHPAVAQIKDHVAFYTDQVNITVSAAD